MSFIFPRTITVKRHTATAGKGFVGYSGVTDGDLTVILSNVQASIQLKRSGGSPEAKLPADGDKTKWRIMFQAAVGTVTENDLIIDDLGKRYQVKGAYWNSLGYQCACELLEA